MQPRTNYLLGVDFGSDSVRCLVVDAADGSELASAVVAYPRWAERLYCDPAHNRYRQHPLDYVESLEASVRQALAACGRDVADAVCGISFDTTASTPALTDAKGTPLALLPEFAEEPDAMFVLWKDHTALAEADEINDLAKRWEVDYTRYSGGAYSCEWVWAKMLHCLRSDPALRAKTCSWVEHCDWICALLTGDTKPETRANRPTASTPFPMSGTTSAAWSDRACSRVRSGFRKATHVLDPRTAAMVTGRYHATGNVSTSAHSAVAPRGFPGCTDSSAGT